MIRRLVVAWTPFAATFAAARSRRVGPLEARMCRAANAMPDPLHGPLYVVMQSGALAAPIVAGAAAYSAGKRRLAGRLLASGLSAYGLAKVVKRAVRRGRPLQLVDGIFGRGKPAGGHGFVSGHAAVSTALALEVAAATTGPLGRASLLVPPVVGFARVYVGAHLPLDIAGGVALGYALHRSLPRRSST